MVHQTIRGTFRQTNLENESENYLAKREALRLAEIDLMRQQERVAELRRALPEGATVKDYEFQEGPGDLAAGDASRKVRLSELFTGPNRSLVLYHLMFGKKQTKPCPMCTAFVDGLNGVGEHVAQNVDMAIVAAAGLSDLRAYGRARGWNNLRLLSCGSNTFKRDLGSESEEGGQDSEISVFTRSADGAVRHFYSNHPWMSDEIRERGIDLLCPIWHVLDLVPQGRGNWYAKLDYLKKSSVA